MNNFQDTSYLKELYSNRDHIDSRGNFLKDFSNRKYSIRDILLYLIGEILEKKVLDIGAGSGSFLKHLQDKYPSNTYLALDIARNSKLQSRSSITYKLYDGVNLKEVVDDKQDIILMMHMLYHVKNMTPYLTQVRSLLAQGGKIYITSKSRDTFANTDKIFRRIVEENYKDVKYARYRDESHFCAENGNTILNRVFPLTQYTINAYDLVSQVIVDDISRLLSYIKSTPRYQPSSYSISAHEVYWQQWEEELRKQPMPFLDTVKEVIFVIES